MMRFKNPLGAAAALIALCLTGAVTPPAATARVDEAGEGGPAAAGSLLVSVGEWPVYVEDLERVLTELHGQIMATARAAFDLDYLIRRRLVADALLASEAASIGMAEEEPIPGKLRQLRDTMARQRLEREEIEGRDPATEDEVRRVFEQEYRRATLRRVVLESQEEAEAFRRRLEQGADFEALAGELSGAAPAELLEEMPILQLPRELASALLPGGPGEVSDPIQVEGGWAVYRLESLREADGSELPSRAADIRRNLELERQRERERELSEELSEKFDLWVDREAVEAIGSVRGTMGELRPVISDPERLIARVGEREILARDLGRALSERWRTVQNEEAALATKTLVLDRLIIEEMLTAEALARGYGETPEVQRARHALLTRLLVEAYLTEVISPRIEVSPEELKDFYEETRDQFRRPPRLQIAQITVERDEEAREIVELVEEGADFSWLARRRSVDDLRERGGDRGWVVAGQSVYPFDGRELRTAEAGKVLGPKEADGRFVVLKIQGVEDQGIYDFEEVSGNVRERLRDRKFRQLLDQVLSDLRERNEIRFHEENISSVIITASGGERRPMGHGGDGGR